MHSDYIHVIDLAEAHIEALDLLLADIVDTALYKFRKWQRLIGERGR